ncbi:MAG: hypothetical protein VYA69_07720 [Gemmatimonadota bacterium]|nr:hypothetical protein [Gemmatimonadota bacterium]
MNKSVLDDIRILLDDGGPVVPMQPAVLPRKLGTVVKMQILAPADRYTGGDRVTVRMASKFSAGTDSSSRMRW